MCWKVETWFRVRYLIKRRPGGQARLLGSHVAIRISIRLVYA